jgi:tetratricopeptide (TPR) repeat protein
MYTKNSIRMVLVAAVVLSVAAWSACNKTAEKPATAADAGKIPVTTKSEDARKEFLLGRDLSERLLAQDSIQHFTQAIALDPDFASAEIALANSAPTAKDFFDHLRKAVSLADKASEGEKLLILATEAGTNGQTAKQKEYLDKLVAEFPNDERAQVAIGVYHFGQQEYPQAIEHLKKSTELAPNFSPAYNMLGYSERQAEDYAGAEQAFKKYIELIPNDPNPYDSYAELLLKMGRFDDSIAQYHKALSVDTHFVPSYFGISADLMYQGKAEEAMTDLQKMADQSRNDGELRTALFGMAVVAADSGKLDKAQQELDKEYAVAEKKSDTASMAADLQAKANISMEMQKYDDAAKQYGHSLQLIEGSNLSQEIKDNAKLLSHYNLGAVAIGKKDFAAAKTHAEEFRKGAEGSGNPVLVRQSHELAGMIALAQKKYDDAIAELQQANQQNPRNLWRECQAYQGKGDSAKAQEFGGKVAGFNSLPQLNYAFVRTKAQKMAAAKKS